MKIDNVIWLVENGGDISIGRLGPIQCAAVASEEGTQLAAVMKKENESFLELLHRLDGAIVQAWDNETYIDEINEQHST